MKQDDRQTEKLTPCSRVLLEKLTVAELVKKFPAFYRAHQHLSLLLTFS